MRRIHSPRQWLLGITASLMFLSPVCSAQRVTAAEGSDRVSHSISGQLVLGAAWYPEQWEESRWEQDLRLMEEAGINMVRVGEFAWSKMEPSERHYDLDWLERAVNLAGRHHIRVVMGTPTAAPPAWLTQKYPDTLLTLDNGRRETHGNRLQYSFTSARYRQFCRLITDELAKRFGKNPNVIGWQIDNEFSNVSYDDETKRQFQEFLKTRYGTLENLNRRWTTAYWSQTYFAWDQIPIPVGGHNPGLMMEWKRFITATFRSYQKNQLDEIHRYAEPRQWTTTNFMGWFDGFDHHVMSEDLDLVSWDDYVGSTFDFASNGFMNDMARGYKRSNYWVMETQPGSVNWAEINSTLDRGVVRQMAWQAIGHGGDAVSYWQWRSALGGQEQYHGTLAAQDGSPVPLYKEVAQIGREFAKASEALKGTSPVAEVAVLFSFEDRWAIQFQRHHKDFNPLGELGDYHREMREDGETVDIVNPMSPLSSYKLVVAPDLNMLSEAEAKHLLEYVRSGGHLALGIRSGMKDEWNALQPLRQPGPLASALGAHVEDYYALLTPIPVSGLLGNGESKIWGEMLHVDSPETEILASYGKTGHWLDGEPAAVSRQLGAGRITYLGGWFNQPLTKTTTEWLRRTSNLGQGIGKLPEGVEACRRIGKGKEVWVIINHSKVATSMALPKPMKDVLSSAELRDKAELQPHDVVVLLSDRPDDSAK